MGLNQIYYLEMITQTNEVICRNTFHFKDKTVLGNAQSLVTHFNSDILPIHKSVMSAYSKYIMTRATLVSVPLIDEFSYFHEEEFGGVPAIATDPRLAIYLTLRGDHSPSRNGTGGMFLPGIPLNWAQEAPKVGAGAFEPVGNFRDYLVAIYGKNGTDPNYQWGVFSKRAYAEHPDDEIFFWYPITQARIRPYFASLRTRRYRGLA